MLKRLIETTKNAISNLYLGKYGINAIGIADSKCIRVYYHTEIPNAIKEQITKLAKPYPVLFQEQPQARLA